MTEQSPRIITLSWGSVDTEVGTFRDAKLWPGGGRGWGWNETGTDHVPGIEAADVEVLGSQDAVRRYNELAGQGIAVGALIRSTC